MLRQNIDVGFGIVVMFTNGIKKCGSRRIEPAISAIDYTRAQPAHVPNTGSV
jgi:hypothetical protein